MLLAIDTVLKGEKYYSESVIKFLNQQQKEKIYVDVIDRQILHFLNKGIPANDVALYIPISSSSVKTRIENMKELIGKTEFSDQDLVSEAKENGMMLK
jgi:DNA-binding NarL/FixJ family response regulator